MSRILIVHASSHGQTRKIAEAIAAQLRIRGHEVDLADALASGTLPPPDDYDAVVLGSRVHMGSHAPEVIGYAVEHRRELSTMPTALFSVSMAAATRDAGPDPQGYLANFARLTSWTSPRTIAIAGGLPYRDYGLVMRWIMKMISRRSGHTTDTSRNHEFTDWTVVTHFADRIADDLSARTPLDDAALTVPLPAEPSA
jgi:menaquinone-dependent protoporphyrinogen oxidase